MDRWMELALFNIRLLSPVLRYNIIRKYVLRGLLYGNINIRALSQGPVILIFPYDIPLRGLSDKITNITILGLFPCYHILMILLNEALTFGWSNFNYNDPHPLP